MPHFKNTQNQVFWLDSVDDLTVWLSSDCIEINDAEAIALNAAAQQARFDALPYDKKRLAEYPPMADYLDAIVKDDQTQLQVYIDACLAVKKKYPKPERA